MSKKINILITGAGGAAAISFFRSLKQAHHVFMADMDKYSSGLYFVAPKNRVLIPAGKSHHFVNRLLEVCVQRKIQILVPTVDSELLPIATHINQFNDVGVRVISSGKDAIKICLDKLYLMEHLSKDFQLAPFKKYDQQFNMQGLIYPVLAKPRCESGSRGIKIIHSKSDFRGIPDNGAYLIQEYLPGKEYSVDVYLNKKHKILASVVRERIKVDSGIAVISQTVDYPSLSIEAAQMAALLKLRFAVNVQFKLNQLGYPCLLEINPRFPGTMPLTVAAGVNMPQMSIDEVLGKNLKKYYQAQQMAMVRSWQEDFLSADAFDDLNGSNHHDA
jgi:carbamoyl-phosphate synthase large subunit